MEEKEIIHQDFEIHEENEIKRIEEQKVQWFGEGNLTLKQRIYQFLATLFVVLTKNFMGKISWQLGLVIYLGVVCPVGTWVSIKWIINLFV